MWWVVAVQCDEVASDAGWTWTPTTRPVFRVDGHIARQIWGRVSTDGLDLPDEFADSATILEVYLAPG